MKTLLLAILLMAGSVSYAQISKVSLQASGLTCSMCSKAVKTALEKVDFVEKVQVDIKNQQYNLSFKPGSKVELDALSTAVEDAGFSVASLQVTADLTEQKLAKDEHLKLGDATFHFLNGENKQVSGSTSFKVVDKKFVSAKEFKKYSSMTKMKCVQTGQMEACCSSDAAQPSRIYHVII